ncbi:cytochrome C [Xenophilus sp. AP218F]|nr:c-type cytochrome [Chromobacterium sp. ASV5]OWY37183.1 cytochrome C [Xenophilus sp. AP218F]
MKPIPMLANLILASACHAALAAHPMPTPNPATIPAGPMGEAIRLGEAIVTQTPQAARAYSGNGLNCTSCHLDGGKRAFAAPWVGIWGVFPEYRPRNAQVNALQDRINDCFQRSINGKPLPVDSKEMQGVLAYMWWLSRDVPTGQNVEGRGFARLKKPQAVDAARGKTLYAAKCAACHLPNGEGMSGPDGKTIFPALWGPKSFNIGAGMARLNTAAAFIKANMPQGQENTLSDQEAYDIAAYFINQPRPDFAAKHLDWPKGGKPEDARY